MMLGKNSSLSLECSSTANAGLANQATLRTIRMVLTCKVVGREWAELITTTFTLSQVSEFVALVITQSCVCREVRSFKGEVSRGFCCFRLV